MVVVVTAIVYSKPAFKNIESCDKPVTTSTEYVEAEAPAKTLQAAVAYVQLPSIFP